MSSASPDQLLADRKWRLRHSIWMVGAILGLGILTWASFLYIGFKARRPDWLIASVIYAIAAGVLFYFTDETPLPAGTPGGDADWVGGSIVALWVAGIVHAVLSNKSWLRWRARNTLPWYLTTPTAAPQPVPWAHNSTPLPPQLAATGIDSAQYYAPAPAPPISPPAALLDVNTAGPAQIAALPGFTEQRARQVTAARRPRWHPTRCGWRASSMGPMPRVLGAAQRCGSRAAPSAALAASTRTCGPASARSPTLAASPTRRSTVRSQRAPRESPCSAASRSSKLHR